ncbi:unnamed protein product [Polarella glacialis]|uniref:Uncharacterized protein n=1 Tax=Polarella glacialis TaxID=89957 RepID=A0A813IGR2_POLGL|nr:unnamed protein product [Polarella glacialis]
MTSPVDDIDVTPSFGSRLSMEEMSPEDKASKLPLPVLQLLKRPQASVLTNAVSGTIGSMLAEAVLFPLDTVKLQVQTASMDDSKGFLETTLHVSRLSLVVSLEFGSGIFLLFIPMCSIVIVVVVVVVALVVVLVVVVDVSPVFQVCGQEPLDRSSAQRV